jgi:hypothetical protein
MRVYIASITEAEENTNTNNKYSFTESAENAHYWDTTESAENAKSMTCTGGISIKSRDGRIACTDFRVESRPQGGFTISCEAGGPGAGGAN